MAESEADIRIFNQSECSIPLTESDFQSVASAIMNREDCTFVFVEVVYVNEDEIIRINREYLDHDYITDIISFRYDDPQDDTGIEGTLFCCAPRISEQAKEYQEPEKREFLRVFIHGLLHLAGYDDQSEAEKASMRSREDFYLN